MRHANPKGPKRYLSSSVTQDERNKIVKKYNAGQSICSIVKEFWINKTLITRILRNSNCTKSSLHSITKEERQKIINLQNNGNTPSQISKMLNIDRNIIRLILEQHKTNLRWRKFRDNDRAFTGIYLIRNDLNQKCYIGQSRDILTRWHQHLVNKIGEHNKEFYFDLCQYGISAFSFKILIAHPRLTKEQLFKLENTFIKYYNSIENGYNKIYATNYGKYEIDLSDKTSDEILDYVFNN